MNVSVLVLLYLMCYGLRRSSSFSVTTIVISARCWTTDMEMRSEQQQAALAGVV